jgi:chromate reductase
MAKLTFCAISGSLRSGSYNTAALRAAAELAPDGVNIVEAGLADIPIYNEDVKAAGFPAAVARLQQTIASADAVLIATPEYNYSIPGVLKNAIDWVSRTDPQPFANKPVAIMGASPGALGTARAQYDLRRMCVYLDAHLLNKPEVMISAAHTRFDADGRLTDQATRTFVASLVTALRDWTHRLQASV